MIKDDPSVIKPILAHLQKTFLTAKTKDIQYRKTQLTNLARGIKELESQFYKALELDLNNCETFTLMFGVGFCLDQVKLCLKEVDKWAKPTPVDTPIYLAPAKSYLYPEPYGVVLILGPWNYPLHLTISYLAYALCAGNCVIIKPSELAPHTSNVMAELVDRYLDKDAYRCIEGGIEVSKAITLEPFDKIMFTGGTEKGKLVARAAADNLVPCILELGGKSPTIVSKEADLENAALRIARARLANSGQTCVACDYVFVHKDVKEKFIEKYKQKIIQFFGQDASQSPDYGRIINEAHTRRLQSYINEDHGGKLLMGGQVDVKRKYVAPTLIENPRPDSQVMKDEIFGPILPIYEFTDIEEVINFINDRPKPLALYYYGSEKSPEFKALKVRTSSGGLVCNDSFTYVANHYLPFGGVGASGYGEVQGYYAFKSFSHSKAVMECNTNNGFPGSALFPPYNETSRKVLRFTSKYLNFTQSQVVKVFVFLVIAVLVLALLSAFGGSHRIAREVLKDFGKTDL